MVHIGSMRIYRKSHLSPRTLEPTLPLSVVVHIDYMKAPLVVQRFGDIKRLVEQTLDPMVSAYFKNIAQTKTLIQLLQERSDIQQHSGVDMRSKFANYSLELQEVLIGTPRAQINAHGIADGSIEKILIQLRERQIAVEQVVPFGGPEYQLNSQVLMRFAQAIENGKIPVVPNIVLGGDGGGKSGSGSLVEAMLAMMLAQKTSPEKGVIPQ